MQDDTGDRITLRDPAGTRIMPGRCGRITPADGFDGNALLIGVRVRVESLKQARVLVTDLATLGVDAVRPQDLTMDTQPHLDFHGTKIEPGREALIHPLVSVIEGVDLGGQLLRVRACAGPEPDGPHVPTVVVSATVSGLVVRLRPEDLVLQAGEVACT